MDSMEQDCDVEMGAKLLQQFSSMGTTDKEVLISDFQKLLGSQLNPATCAFFLDMNNWNLQAAIGSYFDYNQPPISVPSQSPVHLLKMKCVRSTDCADRVLDISPATKFTKTWRIKNNGNERWPPGCSLRFCEGESMSENDRVMVDSLGGEEERDVSMQLLSPPESGVYESRWQMCSATGSYFGDAIVDKYHIYTGAPTPPETDPYNGGFRLGHVPLPDVVLSPNEYIESVPVTVFSSMDLNQGNTHECSTVSLSSVTDDSLDPAQVREPIAFVNTSEPDDVDMVT